MKQSRKILFVFLGSVFLVLAYIGIIMPGIPAIPFILLAGYFFLKSSDKLYAWLLRQKFIGPVLYRFNTGEGVSVKTKLFIISQFWVSIIVAQFIFNMPVYGYVLLNLVGILGSFFMYRLIKTYRPKD